MTDKEYRCQNGDLIEVGKAYKYLDPEDINPCKVKVTYIAKIKSEWPVMAVIYDENSITENGIYTTGLLSLWQEEPEEDGWIKHTTGKQPVADDVMVECKFENGCAFRGLARFFYWVDVKRYRIVEDEQEEFNEDDKKVIENIKGRFEQEFRDKMQAEQEAQAKLINQRKTDHLIDVFGVWLDPQEISGIADWADKYVLEDLGVNQLKDATVKQLDELRNDILNDGSAFAKFSCTICLKNSNNSITIDLRTANEVMNEIKRQLGDC